MSSEETSKQSCFFLNFANKENPEHYLGALLSQYHFILTEFLIEI